MANEALNPPTEEVESFKAKAAKLPPLPYDPLLLSWNDKHTQNPQKKYCYCGTDRSTHELNLMCEKCRNWFHQRCVKVQCKKLMPFCLNYRFRCLHCNCLMTGEEEEYFSVVEATWKNVLQTTIANLMLQHKKLDGKMHFNKDEHIVPFINKHWGAMCEGRTKTATWWATVGSALSTTPKLFAIEPHTGSRSATSNYTIAVGDPLDLTPTIFVDMPAGQQKRKADNTGGGQARRRRAVGLGSELGVPTSVQEYIKNRHGFRYIDAEVDQFSDQANLDPPNESFRPTILEQRRVTVSKQDIAPQLLLSEDCMTVTGEKGYCTARASWPVGEGTWYYEVTVNPSNNQNAHTRIGWAQEHAMLQAPCGYDDFGYSWRDDPSSVFHQSRGKDYGTGYGPGDVIGLLIHIPPASLVERLCKKSRAQSKPEKASTETQAKPSPWGPTLGKPFLLGTDPDVGKVVDYRTMTFFEVKDDRDAAKKTLQAVPGSKLVYYKNGKCQGVAFENINGGLYYPAVSLYMQASVTVNFGPKFAFLPTEICGPDETRPPSDLRPILCKPVCETIPNVVGRMVLDDLLWKVDTGKYHIPPQKPMESANQSAQSEGVEGDPMED
eukprot:comp19390_c0_seq1/m.22411 comp19390_c0_seq1/g.22411  ORF comp19390_c0_seq1/g.22411 comp19390_c0_seq1/m.22411 type:complete len:607 (-) comp19390_c0_seq1:221-2041(-)